MAGVLVLTRVAVVVGVLVLPGVVAVGRVLVLTRVAVVAGVFVFKVVVVAGVFVLIVARILVLIVAGILVLVGSRTGWLAVLHGCHGISSVQALGCLTRPMFVVFCG